MSGYDPHVQESGMESRTVGFAYVLSNPAMPGLVKVNYTNTLTEDHITKLYSEDVPLPYSVEFEALTSFPKKVNARAHAMLEWQRLVPGRDFFRTQPHLAVEAVRDALAEQAGLDAWSSGKVHQVRAGERIAVSVAAGDLFVVLAYPARDAERAEPVDLWRAHADGDLLELMAGDGAYVAGLGDYGGRSDLGQGPGQEPSAVRPNGDVTGRERLVPGDRLLWVRPAPDGQPGARTAFEFSSYCHAVRRTWDAVPPAAAGSSPLSVPFPVVAEQPECVVQAIADALALPRPRAWAPRDPDPEDDWLATVIDDPPPRRRLEQLGNRRRSRTRNAAANHTAPDQLPLW
jgi:hypothetical protein